MQKFLVIDDSQDRKDSYGKVFNFVELDYAFTKKEFLEKIKANYDGYFIDIIYEAESYEDFSFQQILERIPSKKPIFLISSQWQTAMDNNKMKSLRISGKYNDILGYFSWKTIHEGQEEYIRDFVKEQIAHYFDMAYGAFDDNQSISILQISDIEFGNPQQRENPETERAALINKVRKNLRQLGINHNKVDFIFICGDIAYTGEEEQYAAAKRWLKCLGEELLDNQNFENMLIVPGNHDYSFNAAAGNFVRYDRGTYNFIPRETGEKLQFHEHAMYNFAKFVHELNGDNSYLLSPYNPIIKRTYENYGLNFILLNPIRTKADKKFEYGLSDNSMNYLIEASESISGDVCNIVLSHFAPEVYSMLDTTSDATNMNIAEIVNALQIKGWFYGHAHATENIDDRMLGNHKVLFSRTRSLMLNNNQHCEGAGNGFTLFKLERENGKVVNISYYDLDAKKEKSFKNVFS